MKKPINQCVLSVKLVVYYILILFELLNRLELELNEKVPITYVYLFHKVFLSRLFIGLVNNNKRYQPVGVMIFPIYMHFS